MTIEEFLQARLDQEENLKDFFPEGSPERAICIHHISVMRYVLEWHKNWPVLIETPREYELADHFSDLNSITMRMHARMMWLTNEEYRKRFGSEPPTSPILTTWVQTYEYHPDFQEEWRI